MHRGETLHGARWREPVTARELMTVIRISSANRPENVEAVIFETDGAFRVITWQGPGDQTAFATDSIGNLPRA